MRGLYALLAAAALIGLWVNLGSLMPGDSTPPSGLAPTVIGMGQNIAVKTLEDKHFAVRSHDTYGRHRDGEDVDWMVCAQNTRPDESTVDLAVALIDEGCPGPPVIDRGTADYVRIGEAMPNLVSPVNRTAFMTAKDFPDASLIFLHEGRSIVRDLEDYKVCTQSVPAGAEFRGQPVTFTVAAYEATCSPTDPK